METEIERAYANLSRRFQLGRFERVYYPHVSTLDPQRPVTCLADSDGRLVSLFSRETDRSPLFPHVAYHFCDDGLGSDDYMEGPDSLIAKGKFDDMVKISRLRASRRGFIKADSVYLCVFRKPESVLFLTDREIIERHGSVVIVQSDESGASEYSEAFRELDGKPLDVKRMAEITEGLVWDEINKLFA